jgi:hypothetical protein
MIHYFEGVHMLRKPFFLLAMALFTFMSVGCNCQPTRLNVTVELDDSMKQRLAELGNRAIEVDLVVVNSKDHARWENYSMTQYWTPPFERRNSVSVRTLRFDATKTEPQTLTAKDPLWDKWLANVGEKDSPRLYVLTLLPGTFEDKPGDTDARRQILPLCKDRWEGAGWGSAPNVKLQVKKAELVTLTAPKPDKK